MNYDVVVVGGGPAGMASALKSDELGYKTLLVEVSDRLGGILPQCIHPGFGLHYFKEELTGGEFADRFIKKIEKENVEILLSSYLEDLTVGNEKILKLITPNGIKKIFTKSVIFATGARERHRHEIGILGDRVAGIYTAGEAQALMDLYGVLPGEKILIVGSGDVGLIMARRFALEGCEVVGVVEIMPYPGGLMRNVVQCLYDFDIPLLLQHKVISVKGRKRVERALVKNLKSGEEKWINCDTLVIAAGLLPNIDIMRRIGVDVDERTKGVAVDEFFQTTSPGIFAAGNCVIINDLVDYAVEQGETAAIGASKYIEGTLPKNIRKLRIGQNVRYFAPQRVLGNEPFLIYGRVSKPMRNVKIKIGDVVVHSYPVARPSEMFRFKVKINIEDEDVVEAEEG